MVTARPASPAGPLAQCVEWSLGLMASTEALRLRDVEKGAKAEKRGVWTGYVPAPTNQNKLSDTFSGKVRPPRGRLAAALAQPALPTAWAG
jgi:hypothetical protein